MLRSGAAPLAPERRLARNERVDLGADAVRGRVKPESRPRERDQEKQRKREIRDRSGVGAMRWRRHRRSLAQSVHCQSSHALLTRKSFLVACHHGSRRDQGRRPRRPEQDSTAASPDACRRHLGFRLTFPHVEPGLPVRPSASRRRRTASIGGFCVYSHRYRAHAGKAGPRHGPAARRLLPRHRLPRARRRCRSDNAPI